MRPFFKVGIVATTGKCFFCVRMSEIKLGVCFIIIIILWLKKGVGEREQKFRLSTIEAPTPIGTFDSTG